MQPGEAEFLAPGDRVLGLVRNGDARAYPVRILNWHEVVNDRFGDQAVAITYCPLCGTGVAFSAGSGGQAVDFGVSGLLYNSDVLLYDRQTESLWSQLLMQAISGPHKGERLQALPLTHTSWADWREQHPATRVLSTDTGYSRDYDRDPYDGYAKQRGLHFSLSATSNRYHPKERVLGIEIDGTFKAYPFIELAQLPSGELSDQVAGQSITVRFNREAESARAYDGDGQLLPATDSFWFAWYAFHPETGVYQYAP